MPIRTNIQAYANDDHFTVTITVWDPVSGGSGSYLGNLYFQADPSRVGYESATGSPEVEEASGFVLGWLGRQIPRTTDPTQAFSVSVDVTVTGDTCPTELVAFAQDAGDAEQVHHSRTAVNSTWVALSPSPPSKSRAGKSAGSTKAVRGKPAVDRTRGRAKKRPGAKKR